MQIPFQKEKISTDSCISFLFYPGCSMTMFTVSSDLKSDTGLGSSIARSRFRSKNQLVFCVNTELSPICVAWLEGIQLSSRGMVSSPKIRKLESVLSSAVLIHPKHVGDFLQSHSLGWIVVLHDSGHHVEKTSKVPVPLELS